MVGRIRPFPQDLIEMTGHPRPSRRVAPAVEPLERRRSPASPGVAPLAVTLAARSNATTDDPMTTVPPTSVGGIRGVPADSR